jgi:hypothetical protein
MLHLCAVDEENSRLVSNPAACGAEAVPTPALSASAAASCHCMLHLPAVDEENSRLVSTLQLDVLNRAHTHS